MNVLSNYQKALYDFLQQQPKGLIQDTETLKQRLTEVWNTLVGSSDQKTAAYKLYRLDENEWEPPHTLRFKLERHGSTMQGSTRADIHYWEVNLALWTAHIVRKTYRQVRPRDAPLNVNLLADEIAKAILLNLDHKALIYRSDRTIKIDISLIIPATVLQTTASRRKRFRKALAEKLVECWTEYKPNYWRLNANQLLAGHFQVN